MNKNEEQSRRVYRQPLNYENGVILPLIRDICISRRTDPKMYQIDVQTLSIVLPKQLRGQAFEYFKDNTVKEDLTMDGKKEFDKYFVLILESLEDNNICFPKINFVQGQV